MVEKSSLPKLPGDLKGDFKALRENALSIIRSEETFWSLIKFIPDAVVAHTSNRIIYHNPAAAVLFAADSNEDLLGYEFSEFEHPDENKEIIKKRNDAASDIRPGGTDIRQHLRLDGSSFYARNTFLKFGPANEPIYLIILRDITGSLETKRALKLGEKQFQQFFDDANIGMMIVEENSTIRHANSALCNMLGYNLSELKEKSVGDLSHPEDSTIGRPEIQIALKYRTDTVSFEKRYLSKNKKIVWVALNASIIRDFSGTYSHMVCHIENITDRKLSEEALAKHQKGLTQLHKIGINQEIGHQKKIESVLKLGCEMFELPIGFVGKVNEQNYRAEFSVGPGASEFVGVSIKSEDSYCYHTFIGNMPIGYHNVSSSPLAKEPCYKKLKFEAYLGTPLYVSKEKQGTVCYISHKARERPFDEYEISFLELLAQWIGGELHRHNVELEKQVELNKFRALTENAGDAIFVRDKDGDIIEVNQTACERLGYTRDEILRMKIWEISPEIEPGFRNRDFKQISKTGILVSRGVHKRKDGSIFPVEASVATYDWNGSERFIITARDISQRLEENNARLESEEKFRRMFEDSRAGMILTDLNGRVSNVNKALCNLLGYTAKEIIGNRAVDLITQDERAETLDAFHTQESGTEVEKKFQHKDGSTIPCLVRRSVIYDSEGNSIFLLGQIHDISDQRRNEVELAEQKALQDLLGKLSIAANESENIEDVLEEGLSSICLHTGWEIGHAILYQSEKLENLRSSGVWYMSDETTYGALKDIPITGKSTILGKLLHDSLSQNMHIWRPVNIKEFSGPRTQLLAKLGIRTSIKVPVVVGKKAVGVLEFFTTDNTPENKNLLATLYEICSQIGRTIERKWASETLLNAKAATEIGSRAKTEFLANMSHELRSPLTAIIGFSETMQAGIFGPLGSEKYSDYIDNILKSAEHLHDIINDVLDVSAIEAGELNMREEIFDFASVVTASVRMINPRAEAANVKVINNIKNDFPKIHGDARRLKQVIVNLLSNAIRFTPENGSVDISWERNKFAGIEIYIRDTGIGMDAEGIKKALSVFGQVESDFTRNFDGTGLGLPLSRGLIEAHGGTLEIESKIKIGTTVILTLPASRVTT
jgi:PAS domain S-box-containing protein